MPENEDTDDEDDNKNNSSKKKEDYGYNALQQIEKNKDPAFDYNGVETLFRILSNSSKNIGNASKINPRYTETYTINENVDGTQMYRNADSNDENSDSDDD